MIRLNDKLMYTPIPIDKNLPYTEKNSWQKVWTLKDCIYQLGFDSKYPKFLVNKSSLPHWILANISICAADIFTGTIGHRESYLCVYKGKRQQNLNTSIPFNDQIISGRERTVDFKLFLQPKLYEHFSHSFHSLSTLLKCCLN